MSGLEDFLKLQIDSLGYPAPVREFKFHPKRKWRFDFCWISLKLAVEIQGGTWNNGGHVRGKQFASDCEKFNEAQILGYAVLKVTTDHVQNGQALFWIEQVLKIKTEEKA